MNLLDPVRDNAYAHGRARKEDPDYPGMTTVIPINNGLVLASLRPPQHDEPINTD